MLKVHINPRADLDRSAILVYYLITMIIWNDYMKKKKCRNGAKAENVLLCETKQRTRNRKSAYAFIYICILESADDPPVDQHYSAEINLRQ